MDDGGSKKTVEPLPKSSKSMVSESVSETPLE